MHLIIDNKSKLEAFVAIFQLLKNWNSTINIRFEKERLYIQTMDNSHVCLADIEITDKWFAIYDCSVDSTISVNSTYFAILMNYSLKHNKLELKYDDTIDADVLLVNFLNNPVNNTEVNKEKDNKGSFDHFYELKLVEINEDSLGIPNVEYDVEFIIESKKIVDVLSELNVIGQDLHVNCTESLIELNAYGDATKLKVNIPVDDLEEYAISEGETINASFSLNNICKMCLSIKLCSKINIALSNEYPLSLNYHLGENSKVSFFIAPKITDN